MKGPESQTESQKNGSKALPGDYLGEICVCDSYSQGYDAWRRLKLGNSPPTMFVILTYIFHLTLRPHPNPSIDTSVPLEDMALPLGGCVIALSGKFEETHGKLTSKNCVPRVALSCLRCSCVLVSSIHNNRTAKIAALIESNGGKHSTKVDGEVTHLVATMTDVEKETAKGELSLPLPCWVLCVYAFTNAL